MPGKRRARKVTTADLDGLPVQAGVTVEGGIRPLGLWYWEGKQAIQPLLALWVDSASDFVRAVQMIQSDQTRDGGVTEARDTLVAALVSPLPAPGLATSRQRRVQHDGLGLPATVRVNTEALAESVRTLLAPYGVAVEYAKDLPAYERAFRSLSLSMGADPSAQPPEPFAWEIDETLLPALYRAAAGYARLAPWRYMPDEPPLAIVLGPHGPRANAKTLYACVLGGGGTIYGIAFYYSLRAFESAVTTGTALAAADEIEAEEISAQIDQLRAAGIPVDTLPPDMLRDAVAGFLAAGDDQDMMPELEDSLTCFFDSRKETDPTYIAWLGERNLSVSARHVPSFLRTLKSGKVRQPDVRETKALTLALEAVSQFFGAFGRQLSRPMVLPADGLHHEARVRGADGEITIPVQFPPRSYL